MFTDKIFETALYIESPWFIDKIDFDLDEKRLDIFINFTKGSMFNSDDPDNPEQFKAYDTVDKTWRHLNFFDHECYLHCRTPRIKVREHKIKLVKPPWAGINSGFTLLFEALVLQLCKHMPVHGVAEIIKESDYKIWRLLENYVESSRKQEDFSSVTTVGMDETSRGKGQDYITLFVDLKQKRTIFVTEGKDHQTVKRFEQDLVQHGGDPAKISDVSCDMSPAFIKGVKETFKNA